MLSLARSMDAQGCWEEGKKGLGETAGGKVKAAETVGTTEHRNSFRFVRS